MVLECNGIYDTPAWKNKKMNSFLSFYEIKFDFLTLTNQINGIIQHPAAGYHNAYIRLLIWKNN